MEKNSERMVKELNEAVAQARAADEEKKQFCKLVMQ